MTQNKNNPGNQQQAGNKPNSPSRDGNRKETDPNNPVANKGTEKGPNQHRPGPADKQSQSINQQRQGSSDQKYQGTGQPKPGKSVQDDEEPVGEPAGETEDNEMILEEEVPGKRKTDNPDWSQLKPGNPKVK